MLTTDKLNHMIDINDDYKEVQIWNNYEKLHKLDERTELQVITNSNIPDSEVEQKYTNLCQVWLSSDYKEFLKNPFLSLQKMLSNMNITNFGEELIEKQTKLVLMESFSVYYQYKTRFPEKTAEVLNLIKIIELIYYNRRTLHSILRSSIVLDPQYDSYINNESFYIERFKPQEVDKQTPFQNLLYYLLNCLYNDGLKRYRGDCFKPIYSDNSQFTFAWERHMELKDYIYEKTNKDFNHEQFLNLTNSRGNMAQAIEYLKFCRDGQFPEIEKDRNIFSFNNGIYFTKLYDDKTDLFHDKFLRFDSDSKEIIKLIEGKSATKFFKDDFVYHNIDLTKWEDIPTPSFHKIIEYQFGENQDYKDICKMFYLLLGRLLFNVGELDGWQVIPFLKGLAGTGKGTIIKVIKKFYELEDQGILSNKGEAQFGLSAFYNKLIFMAPEIKGDLSLDQATFQSMVSGEDVSVAVKNETAKCIRWTVPGILAGNEVPNYSDNGGSLQRRLIIFGFMKKVLAKDSDPLLDKKINEEIPILIQKCAKAYLNEVNQSKNKNFWDILPRYFILERLQVAQQTNPMYGLLNSGRILFDENAIMECGDLKTEFKAFIKDNSSINSGTMLNKFGPDLFEEPFSYFTENFNIKIKHYSNIEKKFVFKYTYEDGDVEIAETGQSFVRGIKLAPLEEDGIIEQRSATSLEIEIIKTSVV